MEQQLLQADKLASLGQLAAGIAHEINNPLGLILGYTQLMLRACAGASQTFEDLKTIERHVRNCKSIVEALLHFSRKTRTRMTAVDLNEAVAAVVTVTRRQFGAQGIALETRLDRNLPALQGDSEKLEQVLMNLIMNARQAIAGSGTIGVETRLDPSGGRVLVAVSDTGCGIPAHILGKIFDPFFTTKPTGMGTGLGLSVSKKIIELHGGLLDVKNVPEGGVRVTVLFRAHKP
jgi:signal transduction histidine kinase